MTLSEKLFELRSAKELTQDEVAEKLNVSRQAISKWEMGTGKPTVENLVAISKFFGVTVDSLVKDGSPLIESPPEAFRDVNQQNNEQDSKQFSMPDLEQSSKSAYSPPPPPETTAYVPPSGGYTAVKIPNYKSASPQQNAVVFSVILIMTSLLTSVLNYLLAGIFNHFIADNLLNSGTFTIQAANVLNEIIVILTTIPFNIAFCLLFRCNSHSAAVSFMRILGIEILFYLISIFRNYLPLNYSHYLSTFIIATVDGILGISSILPIYLAAAGREGFIGRKKSAKMALVIFLIIYFCFLFLRSFAGYSIHLSDPIDKPLIPNMSVGRFLQMFSMVNNILIFLIGSCAKSAVLSVYYCSAKKAEEG